MLTIRQEQTEAFRQHHLQKFEDEMVAHLAKFAPKHWQILGVPTGRRVIQLGIEQAKQYGFTDRGPVRFYLELMFMFGSYFDTDPQYPWARAVLKNPETIDQMVRADRLFDAMNEYVALVPGPKHKYFLEALQRLTNTDPENVAKPGVLLEESALQRLAVIYPQTVAYLGESRIRPMVQRSLAIARKYEFTTVKGQLLMVALMFFMGHGFTNDPLCGWIARRLDPKHRSDPAARTEELYAKATLYMKSVLAENVEA